MIQISISTTKDINTIQDIAQKTWRTVYPGMISKEQIEYMLELFYNTSTLTEQINTQEQTYLLLRDDKEAIGFASFGLVDDEYKLHKLYCLPDKIGNGYGKQLLNAVEEQVAIKGRKKLQLCVNRNNPAKEFYTREGYEIESEIDLNIGNGYFMNDYIMSKPLR